jgi:hypothetical protein
MLTKRSKNLYLIKVKIIWWLFAVKFVPDSIRYHPNCEISPILGSMLWSQFSAIFANFRRKIWRFSQKPMLWSQFFQKITVVWAKNAKIFAKFFGENILKIITSVPGHTVNTRCEKRFFNEIVWKNCEKLINYCSLHTWRFECYSHKKFDLTTFTLFSIKKLPPYTLAGFDLMTHRRRRYHYITRHITLHFW